MYGSGERRGKKGKRKKAVFLGFLQVGQARAFVDADGVSCR
jgi:hypothetical protein